MLVLNLVFHEKPKHFDVDTHFIRERVAKGVVENVAHIFTKALGFVQHKYICKRLSLVYPFQGKS